GREEEEREDRLRGRGTDGKRHHPHVRVFAADGFQDRRQGEDRRQEADQAIIHRDARMPTTPSSARTALVVEDDADIGKLLQWGLEREGFAVTLIADGGEAVRRVCAGNPTHLVLLDVMLPHASGHEILRAIRADARWKPVPVVMLTAKSQEADVVKAL